MYVVCVRDSFQSPVISACRLWILLCNEVLGVFKWCRYQSLHHSITASLFVYIMTGHNTLIHWLQFSMELWQKVIVNGTRLPGDRLTFQLSCFAAIPYCMTPLQDNGDWMNKQFSVSVWWDIRRSTGHLRSCGWSFVSMRPRGGSSMSSRSGGKKVKMGGTKD